MGGAVRKKCLLERIFREGPRKNYQSIYAYNKFRMADNSCHLCELKVATRSLFLYLPRGGGHFSTLLIVGWALWLFGLSTQSESDAMSVLGLHFERTGSFCFLPLERKLEQLHKEAHTEKESRPLTASAEPSTDNHYQHTNHGSEAALEVGLLTQVICPSSHCVM